MRRSCFSLQVEGGRKVKVNVNEKGKKWIRNTADKTEMLCHH
jgi:hypothetical protein